MDDTIPIDGALVAINAHLSTLSDSERKVAEYVFKEPKKTLYFNVRELAKQSDSSQAAVVRFCKRNGFDSFNNFKLRLARDVFRESDERYIPDLELESEPSPGRVIHGVIDRTQRSLASLETTLDPAFVEAAADLIGKASSTFLFGVGASGVVSYDFMQKLIRLGLPVFYTSDTDLQLTAASTLHSGNIAFVVSYSGENETMIEVARLARSRNATVITLTMDTINSIRSFAQIALLVPASERIYRQGAATSRINQLAVIDILYSIMVSKNLEDSIKSIDQTMAVTHKGNPTRH
ncbi:MurR/RpiR family transcriptional regulator [uncultured Sphaerochaeta sp.]|uniref:MurR/RpiR family transcriptional regulator n=1 Tax=uncultured Sphaerochaeta sp. TaxID=886478 RepID=UPI002A0A6B59|nr:MurR/RpiR family transcriptional regulator [uncultured Sphaerochaeta sp.]